MQFHLKDLEIFASIGIYDQERTEPQKLIINLWFEFDASAASTSDNLADTVDYATIEQKVREVTTKKHYQLLEGLHAILLQKISQDFPDLENIKISLEKFPFQSGSVVVGP